MDRLDMLGVCVCYNSSRRLKAAVNDMYTEINVYVSINTPIQLQAPYGL